MALCRKARLALHRQMPTFRKQVNLDLCSRSFQCLESHLLLLLSEFRRLCRHVRVACMSVALCT